MTERLAPAERDEAISLRLISAFDDLPVPPGPGRLHAAALLRERRDRRLLLVATIGLALTIALTTEPARQAASDAVKWIQRAIVGPPWSGYYVDLAARDASGQPLQRLRFVAAEFPGAPTRPVVEGPNADHGPWSQDGERVTVHSGSKILVGDRYGSVQELADLGPGFIVQRTGWVGPDRIFGAVDTTDGSDRIFIVTVDVRSRAVELRQLKTPIPGGGGFTFVSPDGRWLPVSVGLSGCGEATGLYDLTTDRIVEVVDDAGRPAFASGWLSDGRLVSTFCDRSAARLSVFVSAPGARPSAPVASLPITGNAPVIVVDRVNDRILVSSSSASQANVVPVLDPSGQVVRTLRFPQVTDNGDVNHATMSRDGLFLSFRVVEVRGAERITRAGIVDLTTGQVTYACDAGCSRLALR